MCDRFTHYREHLYPIGPSTTHQSGVGNPKAKPGLVTSSSLGTFSNTQHPSFTTTGCFHYLYAITLLEGV